MKKGRYKPLWIAVEYTMPSETPLYCEAMRIWAHTTDEAKKKGCNETKLYDKILNGES